MAALACSDAPGQTSAVTRYAAPASTDAPGALCSDLGEHRVCWRGDESALVPRPLPLVAAAAESGWRCGGTGATRTCEERARNGSAFACGTQRCLQQHPRMPDDGEWECVEISGVVFCHSRGELAGLAAGPADLGWICGLRQGAAALPGERICVDLDADRPRVSNAQRCRYEPLFGAPQRSCTVSQERGLGSPCAAAQACPSGLACRAGLCLPGAPRPACWLDGDCGEHARCVLGSCVVP